MFLCSWISQRSVNLLSSKGKLPLHTRWCRGGGGCAFWFTSQSCWYSAWPLPSRSWVCRSVTQILAVGHNSYFHENKKLHPSLFQNSKASLTIHLKKVYRAKNILVENNFHVVLLKSMENCRLIWWQANHELPTFLGTHFLPGQQL